MASIDKRIVVLRVFDVAKECEAVVDGTTGKAERSSSTIHHHHHQIIVPRTPHYLYLAQKYNHEDCPLCSFG